MTKQRLSSSDQFAAVKMAALILTVFILQACAPPKAPTANCAFVFPYERIQVNYVAATKAMADDLTFAFWRLGYNAEAVTAEIDAEAAIATEHSITLHYSQRVTETCLYDFARRIVRDNIQVIKSNDKIYKNGPVFNLVDKSLVPDSQ